MSNFGQKEGETCWRNGCQGVIKVAEVENCSCHINPPCGQCTDPREYCPECDWRAKDEDIRDYAITVDANTGMWLGPKKEHPLDPRRISYHSRSHTGSSMIKEGICPEGTSRDELVKELSGTFGGHFEYFTGTTFKYIAYTD